MDTSMPQPPNLDQSDQRKDLKPTRRTFLLQVMLPLFMGVLIIIAGIVLLWQTGIGTASAWADTSLIFLMFPWLCLGLIPIAIIGALWYGFFKLTALLPGPMRKLQDYIDQAGGYLRRGTDLAVKPIFALEGSWAVVSTFFKGLASLIGIEDGETNG
jgi:hypothetical protein